MAVRAACVRGGCEGNGSMAHSNLSTGIALWSVEGSGNTWVRVLYELSTGRQSYTVYNGDRSEAHMGFCRPAAGLCAAAIIKTHMHTGPCGGFPRRIILVRHPVFAMVADLHRHAARKSHELLGARWA